MCHAQTRPHERLESDDVTIRAEGGEGAAHEAEVDGAHDLLG